MSSQSRQQTPRVTETATDEDLVCGAISGNPYAFELIMRRYNQRSFRIARGYLNRDEDAMDVVQDAYTRAFTHLSQYSGEGTFSAWIGRIVRNEALMHLRKHRNVAYLPYDTVDETPRESEMTNTPLTAPENKVEDQQIRQLIEAAVDTLPSEYRLIFILRGVEQLSIEETSDVTGVKAATVKTRFHRAKHLLQEHIRNRIDADKLEAFSFAGHRCDYIVSSVLARLQSMNVCGNSGDSILNS